jgi:hypothetical protein
MRISNSEAEQRAIAIATVFFQEQELNGWSFRCLGASPDVCAENNKERKIYIKWNVAFDLFPPNRASGDGAVDGPTIIKVDILTEEAEHV